MENNVLCLEEYDYKWSRVDFQALFNSFELNELWGDLIEEGELLDKSNRQVDPASKAENDDTKCDAIQEENKGDSNASSQHFMFPSIFNSWVWKPKIDCHQVEQCLDSINDKQKELLNKSCLSILTLLHIKQQLFLADRFYKALQTDKTWCNRLLLLKECTPAEKKFRDIGEPLISAKNPNQCLAIVGSRAILHFAFAFLKRAWRSGEDGDLCTDLLEETLGIFQCLPAATFFNEANLSEVWTEVIEKSKTFFCAVAKDDLVSGNNSHSVCIPVKDRHIALSLYMELSLLQGSLTSILDAVLFLLQLSSLCHLQDSQKHKGIVFSPLVSLLNRLSKSITEVHGEDSICGTTCNNFTAMKNHHLTVSKNFLRYMELPSSDTATIGLKDAAIIIMCYLDSCSSKYLLSDEDYSMDAINHQEIISSGGLPHLSSYFLQEIIFGSIGNEVVSQVTCSREIMLILTSRGLVYSLPLMNKCNRLQRILFEDKTITSILSHCEADHFLAISSDGLVYSWGEGNFGQLGHGHENTCLTSPTQIKLAGKFVNKISCSALYSAFITSSGELYICGGTSLKLLSDDVTIPMHVILPDRVVDVACETMDSPFVVVCSGGLFTLVRTTVDLKTEIKFELCANLTHIEAFKIYSAPKSLFAIISKSGRLHLWNSSCETSKLVSSLSNAHSETEGLISLNFGEKVVDVSFTLSDIVVLLESGRVVSWGEDGATKLKGEGYFIDGLKFQHFNLYSKKLHPRFVGISCSSNHSFAWTRGNQLLMPDRKEFIIDLRAPTFNHLNQLLSLVFDSICGYSHWPPSQDEECLAVSSLNLLNLQLRCASRSSNVGECFLKNVDLASSLKQKIISLVSCEGVLATIQEAAKATLLAGWQVLMPSHEERVRSLTTLLQNNNAGVFECKNSNSGGKFMIRLLVDSLMMQGELEQSIDALFVSKSNENSNEIINLLAQQPNSKIKSDMINMTRSHESTKDAMNSILQQCPSLVGLHGQHGECCMQRTQGEDHVELLDLMDLLLRNAVTETLESINFMKKNRTTPSKLSIGTDFTKILLKFQRIFFAKLLELEKHNYIDFYSGSEVLNASLCLKSYMNMICMHFVEVLKCIAHARTMCELILTYATVEQSFVGLILPEVVLSLLLLQTKNPSMTHFADIDECLTSLLEELSNIISMCPNTQSKDDEMMWERFWAHDLQEVKECEREKLTSLRQSDLENLLKEGMLWTRDKEKAYSMNKLSTLLGMDDEGWKEYIGKNSSEILDPGLCGREILEKLPECVVGLYAENTTLTPSASSSFYMSLAHSLRMLALILGMQAKKRSISTSLSECEVRSTKWMTSTILTGGLLAMKDINSSEYDKDAETSCLGSISYKDQGLWGDRELHLCTHSQLSRLGNSHERETSSLRNESSDFMSTSLMGTSEPEAQRFQDIINLYCNSHSLFLPITFPPEHPISETTRFMIAVLIKHLNLWLDGQKVLEVDSNTNLQLVLPDSIANVCKVICHVKKLLIKVHQDSGRSYKEVCSPILERCRFLLHDVGPINDPTEVPPDNDSNKCRWEWAARKVMENLGRKVSKNYCHGSNSAHCLHQGFDSDAFLKEASIDHPLKSSLNGDVHDLKNMKDSTSMGKEGHFHSFQHSMRHLDLPSQLIVRDIMEFLLHPETINLELLKHALLNQNVRASIRLAGLRNITSLLCNNRLNDSSLFYILLGWQGSLLGDTQRSISCLSDIHLITLPDKNNLEQAQEKFNGWIINKLREILNDIEAQVANYSADAKHTQESSADQIGSIQHKHIDNFFETKRRNSLPAFSNHHGNFTAREESPLTSNPQPRKYDTRKEKCQTGKGDLSDEVEASVNDPMSLFLPLSRFVPLLMTALTTQHSLSSINALLNSGVLALIKTSFRIFVKEHKMDNKNQHLVTEKDFQVLVDEFLDDREAIYSTFDGSKMASVMKIGSRVVRGPNWNWGNQDGPQPSVGTLVSDIDDDGWVLVKWDSGSMHRYRMGKDNKYDLMLFEGTGLSTYLSKAKEEFHAYLYKKSLLSDSNESGNPLNTLFCNAASNLANNICLNVLLKSNERLNDCAAIKLANHLKDIIDLTYYAPKDDTNLKEGVASGCLRFLFHGCHSELNHWSGYGLVRLVSSNSDVSKRIAQFCWIQKILSSLTDKNVHLVQKLQILLLLESILPHFGDKDPGKAILICDKLITILGNLALECSYDQSMKNNDLFACRGRKMCDSFHLLSASHTSTIAEQLRALLVGLFASPLWAGVIQTKMSQSFDCLVELLSQQLPAEEAFGGTSGEPSQKIIQLFGVLSFLGGVDESKLRLGGRVHHEEFGDGTVSGINIAGDVTVQFDDFVCQKSCYYKELTVRELSLGKVIKIILNENMIHQWAKLLYFAFCFSSNLKISEDHLKWRSEFLGQCDSSKQRQFIRSCQLKYFMLKASRIVFNCQQTYRKVLSMSCVVDEFQLSFNDSPGYFMESHKGEFENDARTPLKRSMPIFQHILQLSTQPSPILPLYNSLDLELALISLFQFFNSGPFEEVVLSPAWSSPNNETTQKCGSSSLFSKNAVFMESVPSIACQPTKLLERNLMLNDLREAEGGALGAAWHMPSELIQRLVDMGFKPDKVQHAFKQFGPLCSGDDSPPVIESVITWLLDNCSEEIEDTIPCTEVHHDDGTSSVENAYGNKNSNFLVREDFANLDSYALYVKENIRVGMVVRCCESYEIVKVDDIGIVQELDNDDLHDLNVRVDWMAQGGSYWIGYIHLDLNGERNVGSRNTIDQGKIKVGDCVRVKDSTQEPFYGWGLVSHASTGIVTGVSINGEEITINFPQQSSWNGLASELERVVESRVNSGSCYLGFLSTNHVERNSFDFPAKCEHRKLGSLSLRNKSLGTKNHFLKLKMLKKPMERREMIIYDWKKCVKSIQASSREDIAQSLFESIGGFWESSGSIGKHWIRLEMHENILINQLRMTINLKDSSYIPSFIVIMGGLLPHQCNKELVIIHPTLSETEILLLENVNEFYRFIEIQIRKCNKDGIDCRVPGLSIVGKLCFQEAPLVYNHMSYLASDSNPGECSDARTISRETKLMMGSRDIQHTYVFVWGLNDKDQLGGPRGSKIKVPVLNEILSSLRCIQIAGGSKSLFCVTQDGKLYASGEATNGRLGLGVASGHVSIPRQLTSLSQYVIKKVAVHSGGRHAMALTVDGKVFSWGEGDDGKLGHFNRLSCDKPKLIEALRSKRVRDIACGSSHSAAIISNGDLYTWGLGEYGRLGHGDSLTQDQPKLVSALVGQRIVQVSLGSRDAQTLALTDEGLVYSWGDGDFGKLGRGGSEGCNIPMVIDKLIDLEVCQVECGAQFSLALTKSGQVWTWGKGDYFRLGHGTDAHIRKPQLVEGLKDKKIVHVAVGALHCLAVADTGKVYAWGDNDHGQQGNGTTIVNKKPALVHGLERYKISKVSCGSSHSLAWCVSDVPYSSSQEPVAFSPARDPLGTSLLDNGIESNCSFGLEFCESDMYKPPSLSKVVLSLETRFDKLQALTHLMRGLQILHARNAIIEALKPSDDSGSPGKSLSHKVQSSLLKEDDDQISSSNQSASLSVHPDDLGTNKTDKIPITEEKLDKKADGNDRKSENNFRDYRISSKSCPELAKANNLTLLTRQTLSCIHSQLGDTDQVNFIEGRGKCCNSVMAVKKSNDNIFMLPSADNTESQERLSSGLDDFTRELSVDDSRMIVDLLKIASAGRLHEKAQGILSSLLNSLAKANPLISEMLLELCVTELEDVSHNTPSIYNLSPVMQESSHPYIDNSDSSGTVRIPGANSLRVEFDRQCSTERRHDHLSIMDSNMRVVSIRSGREPSNWSQELVIGGDELHWRFRSDGSVNGWGWRFTVYPTTSKYLGRDHSSDRTLISRPSIHLVTCLLDLSLPHSNNHNIILRLAAALATCSQISSIAASQKIWILQKLRTLMISHFGRDINITLMMSSPLHELSNCASLIQLVKSLPETLLRQFEYEDPIVRSGKQLMFSRFFKVLVGLACNLGLDSFLLMSEPQNQRWSWFHKYCQAKRVASSLQARTELPANFCEEVMRKIRELSEEDEVMSRAHESHKLFTSAHDEQLLQWLNRKPDDWVLTSESSGQIWVWGHNHRGQLGGVEGAKIKVPVACEGLSVLRPIQIVGGEQTLFAVTADGKVYASGYGAGGRLGIGGMESVSVLTLLESIQHVQIKKLSVNSGGKHCLALTSDGDVFSWGEGEDGKLGHGTKTCCDRPRVIETLRGKDIIDVAAGGAHSACISSRGELYTWGKGRYGRLGHGDGEDQLKPKLVEHLRDYRVVDVACGSGDAQTLCLTSDDSVWSWGDGDYGKLGRGGSEGCKVPMKIESLHGLGVIKVECGSQFSVALTRTGSIYTWGKGDYHRLGHGTDDHVRKPKRIMSLQGKKVIAIACGSLHCVCCTDSGEVYTWGDNDEGQLGDGTMVAVQKPRTVTSLQGKKINKLACGSAHSFAWSSNKPNYSGKLPSEVPMEFNLLQNINPQIFRNRLILLHHFSDILCPFIAMIELDALNVPERDSHVHTDVLRSLLASTAKESIFKKVVQATMVRDKPHGPVIEINRIQVKRSRIKGGLAGSDGIKSVFGQICSKMSDISADCLMLPHRVWKVKFIGESVDDCGGGYSESITEICDELQNGSVGILIQTPNGRDESGSNRDCFILNPSLGSDLCKNMFKFFGMLLGIAIRTGSPLNLNLAEPIWKKLVGQNLTVTDLDEIDRDFVPGLMRVKDMDDDSLKASEMPFSTTNSAGAIINLSNKLQKIDSSNKDEYIALALSCRLHEFDNAVNFVREGMSQVVPVPLLHLFTGLELETMVCGSPDIPVNLLKSVATYKGVEPSTDLIRWFWEVMEEFTDVERSLFLRFVWGRTRLPRTIADFRGRDFVIQVLDRYDPPDSFLPESYTCFFLLKMPRYSSKKVLKEKLKYAIHFCKSIDTDDYARIALTSPHLDTESSNDEDGISCNSPSEGATSSDED